MHGRLSETHGMYELLREYDNRYELEDHKLDRMFNLVIALSLYQPDI